MSDEYSTIYQILTFFLPQILFFAFFPLLLVGVVIRFMRSPLN